MPEVIITITLNNVRDEIVLEVDEAGAQTTITKPVAENLANFIEVHSNDEVEWRSTEASWQVDFVTPLKAPTPVSAGATASPFQDDQPIGSEINPQIATSHAPSPLVLAVEENQGEESGMPRQDVFDVDPGNANAEVDFDYIVSVIPNGTTPTGGAFAPLTLDPRMRIFRTIRP